MPLLRGQLGRVHVRHRLVADAPEEALEQRQGEDAGVVAGDLALVLDRRAWRCRRRRATRSSSPSRSAIGRNGRTVSEASAALTLTANGTKSPARARPTCSAMVSPALSCASCGAGAEVRGDHHRVEAEQRRLGAWAPWRTRRWRRRRRGPSAIASASAGLVDDAAAGHVDDADARLGLGQQLGVDQADRLGGLGHVDRDEVGHGHERRRGRPARRSSGGPGRRDTNGS